MNIQTAWLHMPTFSHTKGKQTKNKTNLAGSSGVYIRINKRQPAEMGLTSLPISEKADEVDEHFIQPRNIVYGTLWEGSRHQVTPHCGVMRLKENRKSCGHDPFQQEAASST
jgi:hypothetical protein